MTGGSSANLQAGVFSHNEAVRVYSRACSSVFARSLAPARSLVVFLLVFACVSLPVLILARVSCVLACGRVNSVVCGNVRSLCPI